MLIDRSLIGCWQMLGTSLFMIYGEVIFDPEPMQNTRRENIASTG
jgi:hypothetical protein